MALDGSTLLTCGKIEEDNYRENSDIVLRQFVLKEDERLIGFKSGGG
jgi:hypothetical protein